MSSRIQAESRRSVVIKFAGDSGDGMQITGNQFTTTSALIGNDVATFPDYPAEIRAPRGTVPGVSGFQIHISADEIFTPGDEPDALVAMNAAALKVCLPQLPRGHLILANTDGFSRSNLSKAGYESNPLEDGSLEGYQLLPVALTSLTAKVLEDSSLDPKSRKRCKNFYALGITYWLYSRPLETTEEWLKTHFAKKPEIVDANIRALRGGYAFAEASELFQVRYEVPPAPLEPGTYRHMSGNKATALGLYAAAVKADIPLFLGSYPITPASDILVELARLKPQGVMTFQAEDEIAAVCSAIGASFGGVLAVTSTSGPGVCLKGEALGLAMTTELPLVVVNVQRGGPSTGLPTKTEQSDLLQALYGRNGECPIPVLAANSPGDCFEAAFEAARIAIKYMTPVMLLTDGYLANGSEPWRVPRAADLADIPVSFRTGAEGFQPFARNPETLARPWVRPGTPGLEHRIGGLEHQDLSGNVCYDPDNHEKMGELRAQKIEGIRAELEPVMPTGDSSGDVLLVGWGGTFGSLHAATMAARARGLKVSHLHLKYINPLPPGVAEVLRSFRRVIVAELNRGQLDLVLRATFLVDTRRLNKMQGLPFTLQEIQDAIDEQLQELSS